MKRRLPLLALALAASAAEDRPKDTLESESFADPGWEGVNNRVTPKKVTKVTQDFGHSDSSHAAKKKGEIGGKLWRSTTQAYYAAKIGKKTLDDKLSASGTFALTASGGGSGAFGQNTFSYAPPQQPPREQKDVAKERP